MKKEYLNPQELNTPRFYSHAVAIKGGRRLVYVSGQVSWNKEGAVEGKGDMRAQAERVFSNVTHALRAAGAGWGDVIKMNGYMVNMNADNVTAYREVRQRHLKGGELPASTLVGVTRLVHEDLLLEVEVVAALAAAPGAAGGGAGNPERKAERQAKRAARQAQRKAQRQGRKQGRPA
jgi:enamine deaminase RidA (YjgF/YER057c/UK114 family)